MAILHSTDNITYLMQKTDKGKKQRTDSEMQALADEQNKQFRNMGINTLVKVWPKDKKFNPEFMDSNDNIVLTGNKAAQEEYISQTFPRSSSPIIGWGNSSTKEAGLGKSRNMNMSDDAIAQWGVVDDDIAYNQGLAMSKHGGVTMLEYLAGLLNHETGHNVMGERHSSTGIMQPGDQVISSFEHGETINDLTNRDNNLAYRNSAIQHRQYNDAKRLPKDNYDENKKKYEEKMKSKAELVSTLKGEPTSLGSTKPAWTVMQ